MAMMRNKMRGIKTTRKRRRGQGLLEFALVLPILLMVIWAIIDFGWVVFNFAQLYNGLREGTRWGSVAGFPPTGQPYQYEDCVGVRKRITDMAYFSGVKATDITVTYDDGRPYEPAAVPPVLSQVGTCVLSPAGYVSTGTYTPQGSASVSPRNIENGDRIVIQVQAKINLLTPFFRGLIPNGIQVNISAARSVFPNGL